MNPPLILILQPGMNMQALLRAIEKAAGLQGHSLYELTEPGCFSARSFTFLPHDATFEIEHWRPNVTPIRSSP